MKQFQYISYLLICIFLTACGSQKKATSSTTRSLPKAQRMLFEKFYYQASKQKLLNNYDKAIDQFTLALETDPKSHETMYQLGNLFFQKKQYNKASEWTYKAVNANPNFNHWYSGQLAQLYNKLGLYAEAAGVFETMIIEEPEVTQNYIEASNQYLNQANPNKAVEVLDKLQSKHGVSEEATRRLVFIYNKLGQSEKAESEIQKLIAKAPNKSSSYGLLADHYIKNRESSKAVETIQKLIRLNPTQGFPHMMLYNLFTEEGDEKKAFQQLKKAFSFTDVPIDRKLQTITPYFIGLKANPSNLDYLSQLSTVLSETHPNSPEPYILSSDILIQKKDFNTAREQIKKAISYDASDFQIWTKLLYVDSKLEQADLLLADSEEALELFPTLAKMYVINANALVENKSYSKALDIADEGLEIALDRGDKTALFLAKARAYEGLNQASETNLMYEKSLKLNPYDAIALNNYAYSLAEQNGDLEKADSLINLALKMQVGNPNFVDTKGWIALKQNNIDNAILLFEKAIAIQPDGLAFYEHLLEAYQAKNDTDKVMEVQNKIEGLKKK